MGGDVMALVIVPQAVSRQPFLPQQAVDEGGLAYAGGTHEGNGPALCDIRHDLPVAVRLHGGSGQNRHVHGDGRYFRLLSGNIFAQVRFRQQHHRVGSAFPCDRQIALQPPQVEIVVQAHAQKHGVDVGGHHLFRLGGACRLAYKQTFAGQHLMNDGGVWVGTVGHHIVPHGGVIGYGLRVKLKPAGNQRVLLARDSADAIHTFFL